jgi:t-SNARE complex subunit (syntaxin)
MVDALQQVQLIANQISTQDEGLAQDIQKQVADVVSNMSQGNSDPIDSAVINTINAWAPIAGR